MKTFYAKVAGRLRTSDRATDKMGKWGTEQGMGDGQFDGPQGIAVAPDGSVYVVDRDNNRVQKFSVEP